MKKIFTFIAAVLLSATFQQVLAQNPSWIGNSYIIVNGSWYHGSGEGNPAFDGANLGALKELKLGGQVQDYGNDDGEKNQPSLYYKIDKGEWQSFKLAWFDYKNNNNWYGINDDVTKATTIDLSSLEYGEHTIEVYFKACNDNYDSNKGSNYKANFTYAFDIYYLKNNWDAGKDWTWKIMQADEDSTFVLDRVVFGGSGVDVTNGGKDTVFYDMKKMKYATDTIEKRDTVRFVYDAKDSTLTATLLGRPEKPCYDFGLLINGVYRAANINEDSVSYTLKDVALLRNDSIRMYNNCKKESWLIQTYKEDSYVFVLTDDQNNYLVTEDGDYDFYFKLGQPDTLKVYKHFVPVPDFGVMVNGVYRAGEVSSLTGGKQYRVDAVLEEGDSIRFYDNLNEKALTLSLDPAGYNNFTIAGVDLIVKEKGEYKFFIKIMDVASDSNVLVEYKAPAGLEEMMMDKAQCVKIMMDGRLVIVRDGIFYSPMGSRVK